MLLDLKLPNLHDEKPFPFPSTKSLPLREKNALLESKLRELIKFEKKTTP